MARFYFDVASNDDETRDHDGVELDGVKAVRNAAIAALPDIAREELPDGLHHVFGVKVRDEAGAVVFKASLTLHAEYTGDDRPSDR